jgi:hypothetical protein
MRVFIDIGWQVLSVVSASELLDGITDLNTVLCAQLARDQHGTLD